MDRNNRDQDDLSEQSWAFEIHFEERRMANRLLATLHSSMEEYTLWDEDFLQSKTGLFVENQSPPRDISETEASKRTRSKPLSSEARRPEKDTPTLILKQFINALKEFLGKYPNPHLSKLVQIIDTKSQIKLQVKQKLILISLVIQQLPSQAKNNFSQRLDEKLSAMIKRKDNKISKKNTEDTLYEENCKEIINEIMKIMGNIIFSTDSVEEMIQFGVERLYKVTNQNKGRQKIQMKKVNQKNETQMLFDQIMLIENTPETLLVNSAISELNISNFSSYAGDLQNQQQNTVVMSQDIDQFITFDAQEIK